MDEDSFAWAEGKAKQVQETILALLRCCLA
jgi:hypothetical protein